MQNSKPTRLYILIGLAVLSGLFFIFAIIPNSPLQTPNVCMDNQKAKAQYSSTNIQERNKFIEKRKNECNDLIKYAEKPVSVYDKIDSCNMVDSVMDASYHYMDLHKSEPSKVREEIRFLSKYLGQYNYCPQYPDVVKELKTRMSKS